MRRTSHDTPPAYQSLQQGGRANVDDDDYFGSDDYTGQERDGDSQRSGTDQGAEEDGGAQFGSNVRMDEAITSRKPYSVPEDSSVSEFQGRGARRNSGSTMGRSTAGASAAAPGRVDPRFTNEQMRVHNAPPNQAGAAAYRSMGRGSMGQSRRLSEQERTEQQSTLIPPVDRYNDDDDLPFYRTRNGMIVIGAILLAIVILIISLAATRPWASRSAPAPVSGQSGGRPTRQPTVPTSRPTPSWYLPTTPRPRPPTRRPTPRGDGLTDEQLQRYKDYYNILINVESASDPKDISKSPNVINTLSSSATETPQQQALNWIAFEDELELRADEDPSERIAQRYALAVLYFATSGDKWRNKKGWLTGDEHECTWFGLECESRQIVSSITGDVIIYTDADMVTEMNLQDNNLDGEMTQEIAVFRWMMRLSMYENKISGSLPDQIGELLSLERMWMDNNELGGSIPSYIGQLENLIQMDFFSNRLRGSLPREIGNMRQLERLSVYGNQLVGTLPSQIGEIENLRELFLDGNRIAGTIPREIGNLDQLKDLRLHDNSLIGSLPSTMARLESLNVLYLDSNELTGSISSVLSGLVSIVDLQAFRNKFTGTLPASVGDLKSLVVMDLNSNALGGDVPSTLGDQGTLQKLDLSKNKFRGEIPPGLRQCVGMKRLHLSSNSIEGEIPSWMGDMENMVTLLLDSNDLDGPIPEELGDMDQLLELTLEFNSLTGEVPQQLCRYKLQRLSADCDGRNAPVECSCCTACCSEDDCTQLAGIGTDTMRVYNGGR